MKGIIQEAISVWTIGGDCAIMNWYSELPPNRKREFVAESRRAIKKIAAILQKMRRMINSFSNHMMNLEENSQESMDIIDFWNNSHAA